MSFAYNISMANKYLWIRRLEYVRKTMEYWVTHLDIRMAFSSKEMQYPYCPSREESQKQRTGIRKRHSFAFVRMRGVMLLYLGIEVI